AHESEIVGEVARGAGDHRIILPRENDRGRFSVVRQREAVGGGSRANPLCRRRGGRRENKAEEQAGKTHVPSVRRRAKARNPRLRWRSPVRRKSAWPTRGRH